MLSSDLDQLEDLVNVANTNLCQTHNNSSSQRIFEHLYLIASIWQQQINYTLVVNLKVRQRNLKRNSSIFRKWLNVGKQAYDCLTN